MLTSVPEQTEHISVLTGWNRLVLDSAYRSRTILTMIYDAALPAEIFSCSAGVFFSKMMSLKMMVLHYLVFLLEIAKDEEEDAGITVCLCVCDNECLEWTGPVQWKPCETTPRLTLRCHAALSVGFCMSLELERDPHLYEGNATLCYRTVSTDVIPLNRAASTLGLKSGQGAFMVTARGC